MIFGVLGTFDVCWGGLGCFNGSQTYICDFPSPAKTHDLLPVNLGHGIFKLIFLKDAKQTRMQIC